MDSNHCTLAGGALLLRLIEPAGRDLELSLRECTFDKTGHKVTAPAPAGTAAPTRDVFDDESVF